MWQHMKSNKCTEVLKLRIVWSLKYLGAYILTNNSVLRKATALWESLHLDVRNFFRTAQMVWWRMTSLCQIVTTVFLMEYCVLNAQYVICAAWGLSIRTKQTNTGSWEPFCSLLNNHHCGWKSVKVNQTEMFTDDVMFSLRFYSCSVLSGSLEL